MAEKEGFEPPRRFRPPGFQDQSLQPTWVFLRKYLNQSDMMIITHINLRCQYHFITFLLKILEEKSLQKQIKYHILK